MSKRYTPKDVDNIVPTNPGGIGNRSLYFDKYLAIPEGEKDRHSVFSALIEKKADLKLHQIMQKRSTWPGIHSFEATTRSSLIVNSSTGLVQGGGLALNRLTGMPYIPGSAIKGMARAAAADLLMDPSEIVYLFGTGGAHGQSGAISFLDAVPVQDAPLRLDIATCHHPEYYKGRAPREDNENPEPHIFPVVAAGAKFEFRFVVRERAHGSVAKIKSGFNPREKIVECIKHGLAAMGVGAKTAAGYGWFDLPEEDFTPCKIEILTPCFCAGADQRSAEIRTPSIRGQLRWWYHALGADTMAEKQLFGGVHSGTQASTVVVRAYQESGKTESAVILPHEGVGHRPAVSSGSVINVLLKQRLEDDPNAFDRALLALRAWALLGGLGFRSNRGAGSLWPLWIPKTLRDLRVELSAIREDAKQLVLWGERSLLSRAEITLLNKTFDSHESARKACSDTIRNRALGSDNPRLASPLKLKVIHLDNQWRVLRVAFPGRSHPPSRGIELLNQANKLAGGPGERII